MAEEETSIPAIGEAIMPEPLSDDELKTLVRLMFRDEYVDVYMVVAVAGTDMIPRVFPLIMFGALQGYTEEQRADLNIYGLTTNYRGYYINGWPIFMEHTLMLMSDRQKLITMYEKARQAVEDALS
jgi:hypothetical protein